MSDMSDRELREAAQIFERRSREQAMKRFSRRKVLSGGAVLAAGGILAACGDDDNKGGTSGGGGSPAAGATSQGGGTTVQGEIPPGLRKFPYVDKYNWRRLKWGGTPYIGGTITPFGIPPADWNLMTTQTLTQFGPYLNGLYTSGLHAGLNLDTPCVEPDLAIKADHAPDYTSWTFTIPENVAFHDIAPVNGAILTADDVKFSFERYIDTSLWNVPLADVQKIEAPDKTTVKFTLKRPMVKFPSILALPYYQVFNPKHFADKDRFATQVIGTGAFILKDFKPFQTSHAVKNPNYWGTATWLPGYEKTKLPFVDTYDATYYADAASVQAGLRGTSIDLADLEGNLPSVIDDLLKANPKLQVATNGEWALTPYRVFLNWKKDMFKDARVRRALSMALDRENIVTVAQGGAGVAASSPVPFDQMGLDGPLALKDMGPNYQYNPKEAKNLLAQAGFPNGFSITALDFGAEPPAWQTLVQKYWKDVGVDMKISAVPGPNDISIALLNKNFDMVLSNAEGSILGYDIDQVMRPMFYPNAPANYGSVDDPELTAVMDKIHNSTNPDEWPKLAKEASDVFNNNVDQIYVLGFHTWFASQPWIHTIANTYYTTIINYAESAMRNVWIDDTAPGGRGGKKAS